MKSFLKKIYYRFSGKRIHISLKAKCRGENIFEGYNMICAGTELIDCSLGRGSYIGENSYLYNTQIGRYCCISRNVMTIIGSHPTTGFVSIHPAFYAVGHPCGYTHVYKNKYEEQKMADEEKNISVIIGNDVWIGSDVGILEGIKIGDGAVVAAGALVNKDVPPYAIVGGVPARIIRYRFEEEDIEWLTDLAWWNKEEAWICQNADLFEDISKLKETVR